MTWELYALLAAVLLGLVHLSAASFSFKAQVGNKYTVGARDEGLQPAGVSARLYRANANFLETFPYFAACVLIVRVIDASGYLSLTGCALYLVGRTLFLPLYAMGVPWIRTFSWNIATLGLVLVGVQCLLAN
ncbi:MAG: MAPEG family protein [Alphaproteobacteria bacterium]|nr:MAPEG family protein [Alphaproteobacteria bacterium]